MAYLLDVTAINRSLHKTCINHVLVIVKHVCIIVVAINLICATGIQVVASGAVKTPEDVQRYIKSTLLAATNDFQEVVAMATRASLKWLSEKEFIRYCIT